MKRRAFFRMGIGAAVAVVTGMPRLERGVVHPLVAVGSPAESELSQATLDEVFDAVKYSGEWEFRMVHPAPRWEVIDGQYVKVDFDPLVFYSRWHG